jgi:ATP-dependent helicase HrpA
MARSTSGNRSRRPRRPVFDPNEREQRVPPLTYPDLPVTQQREELLEALRTHQVVVVAGATGSGKTTQLPKLCLEIGRGRHGVIGHTQPRRIAARAVAERLAEELGGSLGDTTGRVAYKVRFTERGGRDPLIKVMTDGILLAEIDGDPLLTRYDTLIIDEAHERSLTIDFLLGYLLRILPKRPDLKVVITSATIDPGRFAAHFEPAVGAVPVIEVSGRTYPVEIRYRPPEPETDPPTAVCYALTELAGEAPGDVLVFLSGEREIRDTAEAVTRLVADHPRLRGTEVVPLYGRLSAAEQHRVFETHRARRVVLATNVAETSLTVPGIKYVIDPGTARISRYSNRLKVQRLPIEPISQASADQRAGRCGRLSDGICIRLYEEAEYEARPRFTDPEIQRTNLASVLLRMASLRLGSIEDFGFLDPPDPRAVKDGVALLHELGALVPSTRKGQGHVLTDVGRRLARLPLDPRMGRMVVAADGAGVLDEVLVVAAALSIQDPRETPGERGSAERQAAQRAHARFTDPTSDFLALLNLWEHVGDEQKKRSSSAFRRMCRDEYLHYLRIREWQDLVAQLREICKDLEMVRGAPQARDEQRAASIHRSLLSGLLSHVGLRTADRKDYLGARGSRFAVSPGSGLFAQPPTWVMAGELVETTRLWGQHCARIEPEWIEPIADHLVVRTVSEPRWSRSRGAAVATERVTLYGIPVVTNRTITLAQRDPQTARELFIRNGLVLGEWKVPGRSPLYAFWRDNKARLEELSGVEDRVRRRGLVVDEEVLVELYEARIPAEVVSQRHFEAWWRKQRRDSPEHLTFTEDELLREGVEVDDELYPVAWTSGPHRGDLTYRFDPQADDDGVTATVPLSALHALDATALAGSVPAARLELATELIRSLPKPLRRHFVPAPDVARELIASVPVDAPLDEALAAALRRRSGLDVRADDFDHARIPPHLRPTVRVVDDSGAEVARSKDLAALQAQLREQARSQLATAGSDLERIGLAAWPDLDPIPATIELVVGGEPVTAYPALVDRATHVDLSVLESSAEQRSTHVRGVRRLLQLTLTSPVRPVVAGLDNATKLALGAAPHGSIPQLLDECADEALRYLAGDADSAPRTRAEFDALVAAVRPEWVSATEDVVRSAARTFEQASSVRRMLDDTPPTKALQPAWDDLDQQWHRLINPDVIAAIGWPRLREVPRYLLAMQQRWERIGGRVDRDRADMLMIQALQDDWQRAVGVAAFAQPAPPALTEVRWLIEELRVSVFGSTTKAKVSVSEQRILKALAAAVA